MRLDLSGPGCAPASRTETMKLTMEAELAVRASLCLAEEYGRGLVPLAEICRRRKLKRDYLAKICRKLVQANLVDAVRGKAGGYRLSRPPEEITLLDVIEAVEGRLALNLCQYHPPKCGDLDCPVRPVWEDLQEKVRSALAGKTLAELIWAHGGPGAGDPGG